MVIDGMMIIFLVFFVICEHFYLIMGRNVLALHVCWCDLQLLFSTSDIIFE